MKLYDAFGREVETAACATSRPRRPWPASATSISSMHPSVGLTPERLAAILREAEFGDPFLYLELAEEMEEKDLHYLAVLDTRKQAVAQTRSARAAGVGVGGGPARGRRWCASAAGTARSDRHGDRDMLDAIGKGFSATEIIWDTFGSRMVSAPAALARSALVHVRLGFRRGTAGAHAAQRPMTGASASAGPGDGGTTPHFAGDCIGGVCADRNPADDRAAGCLQIHHSFRQGERRDCRFAAASRARRDGRTCSRTTCLKTG